MNCVPSGVFKSSFNRAMKLTARFVRDTAGAVLLEFAFVLPLFLLMFFGAITWGYTMSINDAMFDAARQAARELSVRTSNETQAAASAQSVLSNWPTTFAVTAQDTNTTGTDNVRVLVTTNNVFADMFPFIPLPEEMSAVVVMRKELP